MLFTSPVWGFNVRADRCIVYCYTTAVGFSDLVGQMVLMN